LDKAIGEIKKSPYLANLKVQSRSCAVQESKAHRAIMAALFFMKQIEGKNVPDYEQVLRLYRLTPNALHQQEVEQTHRKEQRPSLLSERPLRRLSDYLIRHKDQSIVN
jgi:hypothetical protein